MISIRDLTFRYPRGDFELRVPHLTVRAGERIAVVGASGSGKSTLLDLIAGIQLADAGVVEIDGVTLSALTDQQRRTFRLQHVGLIFQAFELLDYLTVRDNISLPFRFGIPSADRADEERLGQLAADTGMTNRLDHLPDELSQGERQRAAICRALVTAPRVILADEPTGNLDPDNKQRVLKLLIEQVKRHDATLIMVTHDHELLSPFDRVADMRELVGR